MNELGHGPWEKDYNPSGISRAEEAARKKSAKAEQRANERWPIHPWTILPKEGEHGEITNFDEWLDDYRIWVQSFSANRGYKEGYEQAEEDTTERAISWLKEHADDYIVDLTPSYPDAPVNIIVGGMCWEHLKNFLEND